MFGGLGGTAGRSELPPLPWPGSPFPYIPGPMTIEERVLGRIVDNTIRAPYNLMNGMGQTYDELRYSGSGEITASLKTPAVFAWNFAQGLWGMGKRIATGQGEPEDYVDAAFILMPFVPKALKKLGRVRARAFGKAAPTPPEPVVILETGRLRDPKTGRFIPDPANRPSPLKMTDGQRRAYWKQLAQDPKSPLTAAQRAEIEARGWRGPQRVNEFGELETMELSHEPIPLRDGGTQVVPRWPADHAAIDPQRQLPKR